ncbi:hypothetical protein NE237_009545 [Protea cynaroides]|uniref:Uncharacterized protein n=1 Tax=Protea cynaroides TaxID=273540 RepID=A0A9Q0R0V0_9MAGN|nr:hypothetical protein NE237_009545 [Protea cynaroides]
MTCDSRIILLILQLTQILPSIVHESLQEIRDEALALILREGDLYQERTEVIMFSLSSNQQMFSLQIHIPRLLLNVRYAKKQGHSGSDTTVQIHAGSNASDPNIISQVNFLHTGSDSLGTAHSDSIPSGVHDQSRADLWAVNDDVGVPRSIKEAVTHPSWKAAMDVDGVLSTPESANRLC